MFRSDSGIYWGEWLFKLAAIPFLCLLALLVTSQVMMHQSSSSQPEVTELLQPDSIP